MAYMKVCACNSIPYRLQCVYEPIIAPLPVSVVALHALRETVSFFRTVQNATDLFHKIKGDNGQNNCQLCASLLCWQVPADRIVLQYREAFVALSICIGTHILRISSRTICEEIPIKHLRVFRVADARCSK